jgi:hypothetical protein
VHCKLADSHAERNYTPQRTHGQRDCRGNEANLHGKCDSSIWFTAIVHLRIALIASDQIAHWVPPAGGDKDSDTGEYCGNRCCEADVYWALSGPVNGDGFLADCRLNPPTVESTVNDYGIAQVSQ